ncbi:alpha-L-rhamnosidase [Mariniphaga anaerophila]|uniref:Alpha-L-rhamnosidase n=1 Tax=Mariniphaga anaerophila TaxID=1484053 RepID=A0A1M5FSY6_9BACT|nr:alpha-L-rhamnosidase C-terminal domain-containing protein [Mariniphaga anaerophila]SHF94529.1 alpha-L-rhamnosidase [Mariniphaga anaerophila]
MKIQTALLFLMLCIGVYAQGHEWQAKRITAVEGQNESNSWFNFRTEKQLEIVPKKAVARIACDSKFWLWINGKMVVFEGQVKRGPTPHDTYYEEIDIAPFLKPGENCLAILLWYFGKDGFSHKSSGESGLVFQCDEIDLKSDENWTAELNKAYVHTGHLNPNYRLSESNIKFDARIGNFEWVLPGYKGKMPNAKVIAKAQDAPWNRLIKNPIPLWKDYGVREYENAADIPSVGSGEWIECKLPYNCHITPILDIDAPEGALIKMQTDNFDYMGLNVASVRAEYITKKGRQEYESLGWMNGHVVKYYIPEGVQIKALKYRETGFNTEFTGYFRCSNKFYERLWTKAARTLYVTMRDTYMDCPDRERAQWWGDAVNELGEAFYALCPNSATISKKGIVELINWQREDGVLYSPIPEGNWDKELPGQMLASVGYYGFWTYYINTGDRETIAGVYDGVRRYLDVWKLKPDGTLVERYGEWYWGDWGSDIDKQLLFNAWYYLALKGYRNMSELLGNQDEVRRVGNEMAAFKESFNKIFWDSNGYRTANYEGKYDDRAQALAVVSGLAERDKWDKLLGVFKTSHLASPYMEKYVLEALFMMNQPVYGLERMKKRYYKMVDVSPWSTLYENFGDGDDRVGHGTNNHAWSGGGLTILAQYVCGLEPVQAAWETFRVKPQLGTLSYAETGNKTIAGDVSVRIEQSKSEMIIKLKVPYESNAEVYIPNKYKTVKLNNQTIFDEKLLGEGVEYLGKQENSIVFKVGSGEHVFTTN